MAHSFKSDTARRAATLIAGALASHWCGVEAEAKELREAVAKAAFELLLRIDAATKGKASDNFVRVLKAFGEGLRADDGAVEGGGGRETVAAEQFVKWLCSCLPADQRSLNAVIRSIVQAADRAAPSNEFASTGAPPPAARPMTKEAREQARALQAAMLPASFGVSGWPSVPTLGREITKRLKVLRKAACVGSLADVATWLSCVPLQAASSQAVAVAIKGAFEAVRLSTGGALGLVVSGKDLGSVVHTNFTMAVARDFCLTFTEQILVAEFEAYVPSRTSTIPRAVPVAAVEAALQKTMKDYSLTVLAQSRGSLGGLYVRRSGSKTSRDDLVVFRLPISVAASGLLGFDGRPEVYELKPIDSIPSAVPQVTAYSWNYLVASVMLQCTRLPLIPGATISNSVMIPASPENHSIRLPLLTITELAEIANASTSPVGAAVKAADIAQRLMTKIVRAGPFIAVPFMVSGLYGVIPYFVIDMKTLLAVADALLKAIIEALIAALAAYLAAKKALDEFLERFGTVIVATLLAIGVAFLIIAALPAEVLALVVATAILIIVFAGDAASGEAPPGQPDRRPLNVYLGAMTVNGITASQFASWMSEVRTAFEDMWSVDIDRDGINVAPLL